MFGSVLRSSLRTSSFPITPSPSDQTQLEQWASAHGTPQQVALRCRIALAACAGQQNEAMAADLQVSRPTVNLWRKRVRELGIGGVWAVGPGRGRKPYYAPCHQRARREGGVIWCKKVPFERFREFSIVSLGILGCPPTMASEPKWQVWQVFGIF